MKTIPSLKKAIALTLLTIIAGCSGEPSEEDIKTALRDSFNQDANSVFTSKIGVAALAQAGIRNIQLDNIEKIGCSPRMKNSYICEYVIEYNIKTDEGSLADLIGARGKKRSIARSKLLKTSKSWIIDDE